MPQLALEYTSNIVEKADLAELLQECHKILVETLPTDLINCKSRSIEIKDYVIGDGKPEHAFVHLNLKILPGRSQAVLQNTGDKLIALMKNYFKDSQEKTKLQLSVEINELPVYFKK